MLWWGKGLPERASNVAIHYNTQLSNGLGCPSARKSVVPPLRYTQLGPEITSEKH